MRHFSYQREVIVLGAVLLFLLLLFVVAYMSHVTGVAAILVSLAIIAGVAVIAHKKEMWLWANVLLCGSMLATLLFWMGVRALDPGSVTGPIDLVLCVVLLIIGAANACFWGMIVMLFKYPG